MNAFIHPDAAPGSFDWWLGLALLLAGIAHFCVLLAGVQIPARFEWKRELAVLSPMNRKLFWVYLGFIGGTIAAFGLLTLALRGEMLRGDRSALALAALLATWWTARILIDALVFDHRDWPKGAQFVAGHVLLTSTFVAMAFSYWTLLVSSWLR